MRRNLVLIAAMLGVFLISMAGVANASTASPRLVAFGDSYTCVYDGWLLHAATVTRRQYVTYGHSGAEMSQVLDTIRTSPPPTSADVVVIDAGLNDLRHYGTDPAHLEAFRSSLTEALRLLSGAGRVIVVTPEPILAWRSYAPYDQGSDQAVADYAGVVRQVAAHVAVPRWDATVDVGPDGVHPNEQGLGALSAAVLADMPPRTFRWLRH